MVYATPKVVQHSQVDNELPLLQKKTYLTYHLINLPEHEHGLANYGPGLVWVSVITDNLQGYHEHQNKYAMLQWTLGGREAHLETLEEVESCKCYGRVEMDMTKGIRGWWKVAQEEGGHLHTFCVHQLTHSRTCSPCHICHVMSLSISSLSMTLWFTFNMIHHRTLCTCNIKMQGWWAPQQGIQRPNLWCLLLPGEKKKKAWQKSRNERMQTMTIYSHNSVDKMHWHIPYHVQVLLL